MSVSKLATALTIIFAVSVIVLVAELLFVLYRRRRSSQTQTRVDPIGTPNENPDGSLTEDQVIDVFKMLETSRVLCTIKEDDNEAESTRSTLLVTEKVSLQECLEFEALAERNNNNNNNNNNVVAKNKKVVFVDDVSSPCDSPLFFTPIGSPSRDDVSPVTGKSGGCR